jgi:hypothetical protein
MMGSDSR